MPVSNEKYDPVKIDRLKHYLEEMSLQGQPKPYEIFVDNLRVVPKTENPQDFGKYEYYMNEDTGKIRILIYNSNQSPRNDSYCFMMPGHRGQSMNGLGEIDAIIQEKLTSQEREFKLGRLQTELDQTKKDLGEAEEYIGALEKDLENAKSNKYKIGKLDLVELGSVVLENLAMKNSSALQRIGLGGLGGSNQLQEEEQEEAEVSYARKKDEPKQYSKDHLKYLPLLEQLENIFNQGELMLVMQVLQKFSEEPEQLKIVGELLNLKTN